MAKRLTEKAVKRLGAKRAAYWIWDSLATGLGLKVTPVGAKIWVMQLRYPDHPAQSRRTLGKYPGVGLAAARAKAEAWYAWVKQGIDPADAEAAERERHEANRRAEARKRGNTFASVAEAYIQARTNRRAQADAREIRRMLVTAWGDKPIHKIEPRDVRELIDKIKVRAPYDARNAWGHAVGIFKQAVHDEIITVSPCASLDKKLVFKNVKLAPRERVLTTREIVALWQASGQLEQPWRQFYQLLLLLGTRVSELAKARWSELHPEVRRVLREAGGKRVDWLAVDDSVKLWTIPSERFKSGTDHIVPLTDDALRIIETLPRFAVSDWLFTLNGKNPIQGFSKNKLLLDGHIRDALDADEKLMPFVNHDIRRTLRTGLSGLQVADHVAEMVIGHGRRGLQRIYDQHKYIVEQRAALEAWGTKVRSIVGPEPPTEPRDVKVVSLKARR